MSQYTYVEIYTDYDQDQGNEFDCCDLSVSTSVTEKGEVELLKDLLRRCYDTDDILEELGLVRKRDLSAKEKTALDNKYALIRFDTTYSYAPKIEVVDVTNLKPSDFSCYDTKQAFELYQKVRITALRQINPEAYKAYQTAKKKATEQKKKAAARAKKARETKKKRAVQKAKELLKEQGESLD
jgi:hypothetical protein